PHSSLQLLPPPPTSTPFPYTTLFRSVFASVLPGKNAAICHDRLRKVLVHEVLTEVNAMAHPLVRDAAGKLLVETKFKVKLGIKRDRKSTRLNSSHVSISYAVFCLKKK